MQGVFGLWLGNLDGRGLRSRWVVMLDRMGVLGLGVSYSHPLLRSDGDGDIGERCYKSTIDNIHRPLSSPAGTVGCV